MNEYTTGGRHDGNRYGVTGAASLLELLKETSEKGKCHSFDGLMACAPHQF